MAVPSVGAGGTTEKRGSNVSRYGGESGCGERGFGPVPPGLKAAPAGDAEDIVAQHMVGEALLAAHLVAIAEKAGMSPDEINAILKDIADKSAIDEFWITDDTGRA